MKRTFTRWDFASRCPSMLHWLEKPIPKKNIGGRGARAFTRFIIDNGFRCGETLKITTNDNGTITIQDVE